jgi:hypothetical protein
MSFAQTSHWRGRLALLVFSAMLGIYSIPAAAQVLYGTILGTVEDASGAVVPNTKVTVTEKATGLTREATTDVSGNYSVPSIPLGTYTLKVTANGFKTLTRDNVVVTANNTVRIDAKLEIGAVSDQVTVEASAVQLQTDRSETKSEINAKTVQELPLNQYRNYQALLNLVPGTTPASFQNSSTDTPGRALRTFVNGTATNNNVTRLDGATNVNIWLPHHVAYVAPSETVENVSVTTSSFDAEQGMAGGAAMTVVSASGTNDVHGAGWLYHENDGLKARPYFMPPTTQMPLYKLSIFGGKVGGAIIKNKLFYFGHVELTRQDSGGSSFFTVPNAAMRAGDFSNFIAPNGQGTIFDPMTGAPNGTGRAPFPGNRVPSARFSPQAMRLLQLVPQPNNEGGQIINSNRSIGNNHFVNAVGKFNRNNYDWKANWNRNEKHTMFFKMSTLDADVGGVFGLGEAGGAGVGGDPGTGFTRQYLGTVGTNYTISPTMLWDATFGLTNMDQTVQGTDFGRNWGSEVFGIPGTNGSDPRQSGLPVFNISGLSSYGLGAGWMPLFRDERSYTFTTNLSVLKSKHEIRMGFDMVHHQLNHWQPEVDNPRGRFQFGGGVTALNGGVAPVQANGFAQFLLGMPESMSKSLQYELMTGREWQFGWYLRDRWQANRNLTINYGVRVERYPLMTRGGGKGLELLDLNTMRITLGGRGSIPTNPGLSAQSLFVTPRLGFALRVSDKTVIRSGYGMTIDPLPFSRPLRGFYPLTIASTFQSNTAFESPGTLAQGIPAIPTPDLSSGVIPLPGNIDMRSPWGKINRGYIQSWNFTVERRLATNMTASVAYVGTQTTNQLADRDVNAAAPGAGNNGRPLFAQWGRNRDLKMWDGWLSSNYHGLQTSLRGNPTKNLFIQGAYTWSKAINMTDEDGWASVSWNWGPVINRNRAVAGYDRTQVLQLGWLYNLPFGKGQRWGGSAGKAADLLVGGWQAGGIFSAYSGTPFTITADGSRLNAPGNLQTADLVGNFQYLYGKGPATPYFTAAAFANPIPVGSPIRFGTTGRNAFRGPGVAGLDFNMIKTFNISETMNFQFRAEAANLTNTPRFSNPGSNVDGANFGIITGASGERQIRFGIRFQF